MHIVEQDASAHAYPILVEIDSAKIDFYPERHWVNCRCVQNPKTNEHSPKWLKDIYEGREFTAATSEQAFDKDVPEEIEYFNSLKAKYKRRTNVIWLTDQKLRKNEAKFVNTKDKAPGFYPFKALGCPTI